MADLEYPEELRYTAEHEWVRIDGDVAKIGITAYAQNALGDIVYVTSPAEGAQVEAGTVCGEVESTKSVSEIFAPVSGTVVAHNDALDDSPELVNTDPYGQGWMFGVRVEDASALDALMTAEDYRAQLT